MGYSERVCQLCGTSFNVARLRKHGEHEDAAWAYYGSDFETHYENGDCQAADCFAGLRQHWNRPEHIAGPSCTMTAAYSGCRIGVEEMKERCSALVLVAKGSDWKPEPDDQVFELHSQFCFVTGTTHEGLDEFDAESLKPVRHGVSETMINNDLFDDDPEQWGIPIHPSCFEMFKRMSRTRFRVVDLDGLWSLRETEWNPAGIDQTNHPFPRSSDVTIVTEQNYNHEPGTEYLASNPLEVPGLQNLLMDCARHCEDVVFKVPARLAANSDPFDSLPPEVKSLVLLQLTPGEMANLRLASKSFGQIPQTYFHHIVLDYMPWVWEVPEAAGIQIDWHRLWTRLAKSDGAGSLDQQVRHHFSKFRYGEDAEKIDAQLRESGFERDHNSAQYEEERRKAILDLFPDVKKRDEIEWDGALWRSKKPLTEIRGLRNRRRIFADIEEVLNRIEKLPPTQRQPIV